MEMMAAAILVGGRASRMGGGRKGDLELGGRSIRDRQREVLQQVAAPVFAVTTAGGVDEPGMETVRDLFPGCGALGGIYTAIASSPRDRTLVVACDLPFLTAAFIAYLAGIDADLVIPRTARGYEPLCAVYSRACAAPIRDRLEHGRLQASALPEGVRIVEVGPAVLGAYDPDGLLLLNVNTPHDYARARQMLEGGSKPSRDRIMDELGP